MIFMTMMFLGRRRHSRQLLWLVLVSCMGCIRAFSSGRAVLSESLGVPLGPSSQLYAKLDENGSSKRTSVNNESCEGSTATNNDTRRKFLSQMAAASTLVMGSSSFYPIQNANAIPFIGGNDRRQLELCLYTILRTEYWAMNVAKSLKKNLLTTPPSNDETTGMSEAEMKMLENQRKQPYLEARLGAKALLTQKIGGGANSRVQDLGGFQLKECLADAQHWCGELAKTNQLPSQLGTSTKNAQRIICNTELSSSAEELVESLASLVEFDGLETTIDPSPRSSLMLSMYNPTKGDFVYRTLTERVVPSCERYLKVFGTDRRRLVEDFVRRDHGDEVPFEVLEKFYGDQEQEQQ